MADKKKKEDQEIKDIFENKRFFVMEDGEKFYIESPTADQLRQADWHHAKIYNEAFFAGVATLAQMQDELEKRGVIGKKFDTRQAELQEIVQSKSALLEEATTLEDKKELADQVVAARTALIRHNQKQSSPSSQTCEQLAEDAKIEHLTSSLVTDTSGNVVWKDYEDYKTTDKPMLAIRARYEVMLYLNGLPSDFMKMTPEARAYEEIEEASKMIEAAEPETKKTKKS